MAMGNDHQKTKKEHKWISRCSRGGWWGGGTAVKRSERLKDENKYSVEKRGTAVVTSITILVGANESTNQSLSGRRRALGGGGGAGGWEGGGCGAGVTLLDKS